MGETKKKVYITTMRFVFFFACLLCAVSAMPQVVDYNRLDSEQQAVAADGIAGLCPANQEWFSNTCSKHPDGSFDPVWAKRMLLNKFAIEDIQQYGDLFTVMMAYQRMEMKGTKLDRKAPKQQPPVEQPKPDSTPSRSSKSKKDTDRSTKEERVVAMHDTTVKLQSQLVSMKKCAKF